MLMKKILLTLLMSLFLLNGCNDSQTLSTPPENNAIVLGIDQPEVYGPLLSGKRVALMVNQSSIDSSGQHAIEKLIALQTKYNFTVTTLFSVEHGLRGNEEAGFGDKDYIDPATGLQVWSLYGSDANGKRLAHPSEEKLANVDVVIFDLQDVGVRFFTYTISMQWMMESIQAYGKEFMVFDRPNPNGDSIYGPLLEQDNVSNIGIAPVPMAHGLTSGEFARMIVGQGWLKGVDNADNRWDLFGLPEYRLPASQLHVIAMKNYTHATPYSLPKPPSPNLRTDMAIRMYPSLALFEATSVNMGRGSDYPHEQTGYPDNQFYINTEYQIDSGLTALGWPQGGQYVWGQSYRQEVTGVSPQQRKPSIQPFVQWWFNMEKYGYKTYVGYGQESQYLQNADRYYVIRPAWLAKLVGSKSFLEALKAASENNLTEEETIRQIEAGWETDLQAYKAMRQKYILYKDGV
ncbi:conserved exported hypothetical protein [Enterobacterales bacterium 8AC]|nr:conserved exported hypothetical protein [Enterobacterales bacterium 8AC]